MSTPGEIIVTDKAGNSGERTTDDIRQDLERVENQIKNQVSGIREDLSLSNFFIGDRSIAEHLRKNLWPAVGIAAGSMALMAFLRTINKKEPDRADVKNAILQSYLDDVVEDVSERVSRGGDMEWEIKKALRKRAPLLVIEKEKDETASRGAVSSVFRTAAKSLLGIALGIAGDQVMAITQAAIMKSGKADSPDDTPIDDA